MLLKLLSPIIPELRSQSVLNRPTLGHFPSKLFKNAISYLLNIAKTTILDC